MRPTHKLAIFALVCLAQLVMAGWGIVQHERALSAGTPYRFETAPVDPLDPFRGRYVRLEFAAERVDLPMPDGPHDSPVYAVLNVGPDGFAEIDALRRSPPAQGDYLRVQAYPRARGDRETTVVELPFDRYYMQEHKAPRAERLVRDRAGADGAKPAYAIVRVHGGMGVLEALHVDGVPIEELTR